MYRKYAYPFESRQSSYWIEQAYIFANHVLKFHILIQGDLYLYKFKKPRRFSTSKKLVCLGIALVMLFSLAGLSACDTFNLARYKAAAKIKLETYAKNKGQDNYTAENWTIIGGLVTDGKAAVDAAANEPAVDVAVETAKEDIDAVLTKAQEDAISLAGYKITAKITLETYAKKKGEENYITENWTIIGGFVTDGKAAIDAAADKAGVNSALHTTKEDIDNVLKEGEVRIIEVEIDDMIELHTWYPTSGIPNNVIVVKYSDENAVFECTVDNGQLWLFGPYWEKILNVKPNNSFRWMAEKGNAEQAFIDIILRMDNKIIGYSVIEVYGLKNRSDSHSARILKAALFPKVNGEYQNATEEYVKAAIEKIKEPFFVEIGGARYALTNDSKAILTKYTGDGSTFTVPKTVIICGLSRDVVRIGAEAFSDCIGLTGIAFGADSLLESIGMWAFQRCTALEYIFIPNSVTDIGIFAFNEWTSAQAIYVQTHTSKPAGWHPSWLRDCDAQVVWGVD